MFDRTCLVAALLRDFAQQRVRVGFGLAGCDIARELRCFFKEGLGRRETVAIRLHGAEAVQGGCNAFLIAEPLADLARARVFSRRVVQAVALMRKGPEAEVNVGFSLGVS